MKNYEIVGKVNFPKPQNIKINMMPFVIGDESTLPYELFGYQSLIDACQIEVDEHGKIGYLTVMESPTKFGVSHRRGGIHTEKHPDNSWGGGGWGAGAKGMGGLYMASNTTGTTGLWDVHVDKPGRGGDCEHIRNILGQPYILDAGELAWLTDSCPHESLPSPYEGIRQFFRVVTSAVSIWYEDHSTPNPLGIVPPDSVMGINGNKFEVVA